MSKENVVEQLQENIKVIYRKAVDADKQLELLRSDKKASFAQIFSSDTIFTNHATTFLPYVEELVADLLAIQEDTDDNYKALLPAIVTKIELLFKMLEAFSKNLKD